ncbi:hypothetical protein [Levilactobacillus zymae]|uniref:flavodoxin family protein n=1 Tax=Levilactobacillus zymae TaxID=267363 RepID=UPI0028B67869|nr:hypothetical protein [Levilactobacillus zymae]MDT6980630.1 hypothetical protein [Levilactobacillus zymae]
MNTQVVYFSNSGHNKRLAENIARHYGTSAVPIIPVEDYPMNYNELTAQAKHERFHHVEVPIQPLSLDPKADVLILVSPIWYADLPRSVVSFLKQLKHTYARVTFTSDKFMVGFGTCGQTLRRYLSSPTVINKVAANSTNFSRITAILDN